MQLFGFDLTGHLGLILVTLAAIALYIASRSAADALVGGTAPTPGRLAFGQWLPIAAVALGAMFLNQPAIAVGVIFATSVASLSLAAGTVIFLQPMLAPPGARRAWPMILPAALLAFLAGFHGALTGLHAVILAVEGIIVLMLWNDRNIHRVGAFTDAAPSLPISHRRRIPLRIAQLILAAALAAIGAWAMVRGADRASHLSAAASTGLLSATLLSPLLILPMLGSGVDLAHRRQSDIAVSSQVGVVLLNLCALVPLIIVFSYARGYAFQHTEHLVFWQHLFHVESAPGNAVPFPLAPWRVDAVLLIVLGLFCLPVALGKWTWSKMDGLALIGGYAAYLLLAMAMGVRAV
jgi:Ca2+/Na+ antiporter